MVILIFYYLFVLIAQILRALTESQATVNKLLATQKGTTRELSTLQEKYQHLQDIQAATKDQVRDLYDWNRIYTYMTTDSTYFLQITELNDVIANKEKQLREVWRSLHIIVFRINVL